MTQQALHDTRRLGILASLVIAQRMVDLGATVVNIALPSARHQLGFSNNDRALDPRPGIDKDQIVTIVE